MYYFNNHIILVFSSFNVYILPSTFIVGDSAAFVWSILVSSAFSHELLLPVSSLGYHGYCMAFWCVTSLPLTFVQYIFFLM